MHAGNMTKYCGKLVIKLTTDIWGWLLEVLLCRRREPVACRSMSSVFGLSVEVYNVCVNEAMVPVILKFSPCNIETFCWLVTCYRCSVFS